MARKPEVLQNTDSISDEEVEYFAWIFRHIAAGNACVIAVKERAGDSWTRVIAIVDEKDPDVPILCPVAMFATQKHFMDFYEAPEGSTSMQANEDGTESEYEG